MEFVYNDMSAQVSMAQYINDCVDVPRIIKGCQGCKNYARLRYSIESLGGDVEKTLELYFNERLLWGREGHMPEYMLLVGGLMQK